MSSLFDGPIALLNGATPACPECLDLFNSPPNDVNGVHGKAVVQHERTYPSARKVHHFLCCAQMFHPGRVGTRQLQQKLERSLTERSGLSRQLLDEQNQVNKLKSQVRRGLA